MKEPKRRRLTTLIVQAGIANSVREAQELLFAGQICVGDRHGSGKRMKFDPPCDPSEIGGTLLNADIRVSHRNKCPECGPKPIVFVKRDKRPASSSTTHSRVQDPDGCDDYEPLAISSLDLDPALSRQEELQEWLLRRKHFAERDDWIARALSRGATVEEGMHTAELTPTRDEDGRTCLKVVVR